MVTKNKKILFGSIFIFSIFLIFLGMRNSYLSEDKGPKQRPRAIVENGIKHTPEIINQLDTAVACPQEIASHVPSQRTTPLGITISIITPPLASQADLSARAPPTFFLQTS
jgi:hypothetical protein